jgi:hypothetical protein
LDWIFEGICVVLLNLLVDLGQVAGKFSGILLLSAVFWLEYKGRNHIVVLFQVSERLGLRISGLVVHGFSG